MQNELEELNSQFLDFTEDSNVIIKKTCLYIENNYENRVMFADCLYFIKHFSLGFSSKSKLGIIVNLISSMDFRIELFNALNLASIGVYKSSFDSLRRALEITLVGFYFDLVKGDELKFCNEDLESEILNWYESKFKTPYFSDIKKQLPRKGYFKTVNEKINWISQVEELYHYLSDITHTKGYKKSILSINKVKNINGKPEFKEESLNSVLESFLSTTQIIATLYAIHNPILTYGLPIFEKYGYSSMGGLFDENQSKILLKIIPECYKSTILEIVKNDNSIQDRIKEIKEMPVSEDYLRFRNIFNSNH